MASNIIIGVICLLCAISSISTIVFKDRIPIVSDQVKDNNTNTLLVNWGGGSSACLCCVIFIFMIFLFIRGSSGSSVAVVKS